MNPWIGQLVPPEALVPLPVAVPLAIAGLMLAASKLLPGRTPNIIAILTALFNVAAGCLIVAATAAHPLAYWFGGWTPRPGIVIGIGFAVDRAGALVATLIGVLFTAAFVFAWGLYEETSAHFQILMLVFMAAMTGFCFTHDLFNLFVWFEAMSVTAFALTAADLKPSQIEGALNFTVVNTIGSFLMLGGIGIVYARAGALDFTAIGRAMAQQDDALVVAGFLMLSMALLIKGAMVPFHFWLSDAHAVAPSPVSVIFSGAMVALGIFGLGRLCWAVFPASGAVTAAVQGCLVWIGALSTVLGGAMCLLQRHLKRLLAFSTISHTGILLIGLAVMKAEGTAGMLTYLIGHGLVKAALFMVAGILLARCGGIDELSLRGEGRSIWPAGIILALGGLALAGLPVGLMEEGARLTDASSTMAGHGWTPYAIIAGAALTGGAVLRASGRIFLGWGELPAEEEQSPTDDDQEKSNRPLWLMLAPAAFLLLLALAGGPLSNLTEQAAAGFVHPNTAALGLGDGLAIAARDVDAALSPQAEHPFLSWIGLGLALVIAGYELGRRRLAKALTGSLDRVLGPLSSGLGALHSGLIGDYVTWVVVGMAIITAFLAS